MTTKHSHLNETKYTLSISVLKSPMDKLIFIVFSLSPTNLRRLFFYLHLKNSLQIFESKIITVIIIIIMSSKTNNSETPKISLDFVSESFLIK